MSTIDTDNDSMPLQNAAVSYSSITPAWLAPPTGSSSPLTLESGDVWANNGTGVTLKYEFWTSLPSYYDSSDTESHSFQPFSASMKAGVVSVLGMISTFANITFVETTIESQAQLGYGQAHIDPDAGAWAYYPSLDPRGGDVWTNNLYANTQVVTPGSYGFYALMHETGHTLGLQHTFDAGLTGALNTEQYSVMAYDWSPWGNSLFAQSYMLYDIYALQNLYGANMTYHTGDDNYALQSGKAYTIWDAGGNDTMDASAVGSGATIRLDAGSFSSVGLTNNIAIAYGVAMENAKGSNYNDTFYGNAGNNVITANGGNDTIYADNGDDTVNGGIGTDTVIYATALTNFVLNFIDAVTVTVQDIIGTLGTDTLSNIENFIFGGLNYDWAGLQSGTPGGGTPPPPPTLPSMTVSLVYTGGSTKIVSTTEGVTTLTAATMKYSGKTGNLITTDRDGDDLAINFLQNVTISSLTFTGTSANESIHLNGTASVIAKFTGGAGDDSLTIASTITGTDTISGGDGNDTFHSGAGTDTVKGDGGNDILYGDDGNDKLYGGTGDDTLHGGLGTDYLYGEAGNNTLYGDDGNDYLYGDTGIDIADGGAGNDTINGAGGNDTLHGGSGIDTIHGNDGNDTITGDDGNDKLYGDDGIDTIDGGAGDDGIYGGAGDDTLHGGLGIDTIDGNDGNDTLYGDDGNDLLHGYAGNDVLYGDAGVDKLYGGLGNDTIHGGAGADSLYGESGSDTFVFTLLDGALDTVNDFTLNGSSKDYLNITDILTGFDKGVDNIADFVKFTGSSSSTTVSINADGAGSDWVALVTLKGSVFTGATAASLLLSGQLITDHSV